MNKLNVTEQEVLTFLKKIESGEIKLTPTKDPQSLPYDDIVYVNSSNDWELCVSNWAHAWGGLCEIEFEKGLVVDSEYWDVSWPEVSRYFPSDEVAWKSYGLPGMYISRCIKCEAMMEYPGNGSLCSACK